MSVRRNLPYPRAHAVTEWLWETGVQPFSRALGNKKILGTYGTIMCEFVERGTFYVGVANPDEALWWLDKLRDYAEVVSTAFYPSPDQEITNLPFTPPQDQDGSELTIQELIIR